MPEEPTFTPHPWMRFVLEGAAISTSIIIEAEDWAGADRAAAAVLGAAGAAGIHRTYGDLVPLLLPDLVTYTGWRQDEPLIATLRRVL